MRDLIAVALLVFATGAPAFAQDRPLAMNFGGGVAVPVTGLNDAFNTGWNGTLGVTWNATPKIGVQAEYVYDRFGGPERQFTISQTPTPTADDPTGLIQSNHQVHTGTFNLIYRPQLENRRSRGLYLLGGAGVYHRLVQLTAPSTGYTSVCNPYWYICYPTTVPVTRIIGDRSSNDFGVNVGAGLTFGGSDPKFYLETRYHYVWGPKIRPDVAPLDGTTEYSTNAGYIPITFGVRW